MSACLVCPDESEFQPVITDKYGRRLLILRVAFGAHYQDRRFLANTSMIAWLYKRGLIDGVILYQVYLASATPQQQAAFAWQLIGPKVPDWLIAIMIDVEHWGGTSYAVNGDHSKAINTLYGLHAHKMGHWNGCGIYGNRNDLASICPKRDPRAWVIVASYGTSLIYTKVKGAIGQQYTDGQAKWGVPSIGGLKLPMITSGVRCDHNVFDPKRFPTAKALRQFMRPAMPVKAPATATVKAPVVPVAPTPYYAAGSEAAALLSSPDRQYAAFLRNDGRIDVRRVGKHAHYL